MDDLLRLQVDGTWRLMMNLTIYIASYYEKNTSKALYKHFTSVEKT